MAKKKKKQKRRSKASTRRKKKPASGRAKKASKKKKAAKKKARKTAGGKAKKSKKTKKVKKSKAAKKSAKKTAGRGNRKKTRLTKKELEEFRRLLLEKRQMILGDMNDIESQAVQSQQGKGESGMSSMPTHLADLGTDNFEQEFTLGLLQSESVMLEEIDQALARIDDGTYGICLGTGKPIPKARLRARPWAKYCVEYARKIEQGLVRPGEEEESSE